MGDKLIRQNVIDELDFDPSIDAAHIGVAVENGIVTLTGHVGSYTERVAAEKAAQKVRGVRGVVEEIQVRFGGETPPRDEDIAQRAVQMLDWSVTVPKGAVQVKVQNGWVTLSGKVDWQYQREEAYRAIRRLAGVAGIMNTIEVTPKASVPDVRSKIMAALKRNAELEADAIKVTVKDAKVVLEGKVNAWYERELAENAAWSAPGVRAVEDHLTLG
ncbi:MULTISPECIES: BON domain-containing protein [Methylobacteriaceae]|jgi:osmotically-inducible protein OsmY|uniref:BON domain-containing protein n=4 Tax=Pseudomonadota TaxID=1224 RepID=A0ABU9ZL09_9HYPH|nr:MULTISPECIES: BON domain-containing protein [Methylobacteriaceae]MBY0143905.1 BON domain-containing protein [Methylorubrum populi]MCX7329926.1 BON domain-containing protein [Hyphomicrobiales bacterium]MBB5760872.1 osmotically-inducible protein OsmY [Methylorubrum rhodesianum]MBI1691008.1 BON domain-containing protein [Methylorubrum sp. DB1722]MBK3402301.1 BON domain-containing protein [Methylorubrum rhodesianum]